MPVAWRILFCACLSYTISQFYRSANAVIGPEDVLRFFRDDGNEHAAGAVARIRLYSRVLTPDEVAGLDREP